MAHIYLLEGVAVAEGGPYQQVAEAGGEAGLAVDVGSHVCKSIILCIVIEFELHLCLDGEAVLVLHGDGDLARGGIVRE